MRDLLLRAGRDSVSLSGRMTRYPEVGKNVLPRHLTHGNCSIWVQSSRTLMGPNGKQRRINNALDHAHLRIRWRLGMGWGASGKLITCTCVASATGAASPTIEARIRSGKRRTDAIAARIAASFQPRSIHER